MGWVFAVMASVPSAERCHEIGGSGVRGRIAGGHALSVWSASVFLRP